MSQSLGARTITPRFWKNAGRSAYRSFGSRLNSPTRRSQSRQQPARCQWQAPIQRWAQILNGAPPCRRAAEAAAQQVNSELAALRGKRPMLHGQERKKIEVEIE